MSNMEVVIQRFNNGADAYDGMVKSGNYSDPSFIASRLESRLGGGFQEYKILDIGCGTGVCGALLKPLASQLDGVDISEKMVEKARCKGIYDSLQNADLISYLERLANSYDIVVASGVLPFFSHVEQLFALVHSVLLDGGHFAFMTYKCDDEGLDIKAYDDAYDSTLTLFKHRQEYIQRVACASGFAVIDSTEYVSSDGCSNPDEKLHGIFYLLQKS